MCQSFNFTTKYIEERKYPVIQFSCWCINFVHHNMKLQLETVCLFTKVPLLSMSTRSAMVNLIMSRGMESSAAPRSAIFLSSAVLVPTLYSRRWRPNSFVSSLSSSSMERRASVSSSLPSLLSSPECTAAGSLASSLGPRGTPASPARSSCS